MLMYAMLMAVEKHLPESVPHNSNQFRTIWTAPSLNYRTLWY
jgi:hypothetical protein